MNSKKILRDILVASVIVAIMSATTVARSVFSRHSSPSRTLTSGLSRPTQPTSARKRRARSYDVLHYVIRTSFDVPNKALIGEVDVTLKPLGNGFRTVELDAEDMTIERVSLSDGTRLTSKERPGTLLITLDRDYSSADTVTVVIRYRTVPQRGLYFILSSDTVGFQRPRQIWTQGEPEENHYWFPCYDFPDDKVTSEQYITTGSNEIAIANGILVQTVDNPDNTRTFHWQMNQPHSSYLISLVVGDYTKLTDSYGSVPLEYYTYRGTETQALRAFSKTPTMMRWFSERLGHGFPYDKYAQTVVGNFIFGGMENISATTLADTEILDPDINTLDYAKLNLVSHELAHSWFGNLVTCRDWSHLWLNEGFATFLEAAFLESQFGREAYLQELRKDAAFYYLDDATRNRHPLVNPNYPLTIELFDATTYKKGAFVVHMLRETVGNDVFWRALNLYLSEYEYSIADSKDLQKVFERVSGQSLEWFFAQWVYKAGYPELRVNARYNRFKRQLTLGIRQTQKPGIMGTSVFRLPLDIEIATTAGTHSERIEINRRRQDFVLQLDGHPRTVTIDRDVRLLKKLIITGSRSTLGFGLQDGAALTLNTMAPTQPEWFNTMQSIFVSRNNEKRSASTLLRSSTP